MSDSVPKPNFLGTILYELPILVWIKDINGKYIYCNKTFEEFFGYSLHQIVGKHESEFMDKNIAKLFNKNIEELLEKSMVTQEESLVFKDENSSYLEIIQKVVYDNDKNLIGILGVAKDITELRNREILLTDFSHALTERIEQEVFLRIETQNAFFSMFEHSPLGVLKISKDGFFLNANSSALKMIGYSFDEIKDKNIIELSPEIQPETSFFSQQALSEIIDAVLNGEIRNFEWTYIHKNSRELLFDVTFTLFGNKKDEILVFWRDITEIKRLQEDKKLQEKIMFQQSKLAEMGDMIGAIAHQWKQPLNAINILADMIKDDVEFDDIDPNRLKEISENIKKQIAFMNQTIDDFRKFLSPDKEKSEFYACNVIEDMINIFKIQFAKDNINVTIHPHEHFLVSGYKNELKQVFLNIFKNAKDAFSERNIIDKKIDIFITNDSRFGKIVVCDNAGGIPEHLLPDKLFEKYVSTKGEKGTGIGLQISKRIIEDHFNGKIRAYNNKNGACFEIILPIKKGGVSLSS